MKTKSEQLHYVHNFSPQESDHSQATSQCEFACLTSPIDSFYWLQYHLKRDPSLADVMMEAWELQPIQIFIAWALQRKLLKPLPKNHPSHRGFIPVEQEFRHD